MGGPTYGLTGGDVLADELARAGLAVTVPARTTKPSRTPWRVLATSLPRQLFASVTNATPGTGRSASAAVLRRSPAGADLLSRRAEAPSPVRGYEASA